MTSNVCFDSHLITMFYLFLSETNTQHSTLCLFCNHCIFLPIRKFCYIYCFGDWNIIYTIMVSNKAEGVCGTVIIRLRFDFIRVVLTAGGCFKLAQPFLSYNAHYKQMFLICSILKLLWCLSRYVLESFQDFCITQQVKALVNQTIHSISSLINHLIWGLKTRNKPSDTYKNRHV